MTTSFSLSNQSHQFEETLHSLYYQESIILSLHPGMFGICFVPYIAARPTPMLLCIDHMHKAALLDN